MFIGSLHQQLVIKTFKSQDLSATCPFSAYFPSLSCSRSPFVSSRFLLFLLLFGFVHFFQECEVMSYHMQGVQKFPGPIQISTSNRHDEANLVSFATVLSIILSDPGEMLDSVPKHALDVVKSGVIPYLGNCILNFITRGKLSIPPDLL
jgi:hypothetical protein